MADSSKVIIVLSVCIGLFFLLVGTLKFTPIVVKDLYFDARKSSIKLAESPLVAPLIFSPQGYRRLRSTLEVVCGLILAFVPGALKHYANIVLLALCLTHIILVWAATATMPEPDHDDKPKEDARPKSRASQLGLQACSTELVFSLLLACRLLMVAQNARHVSSLAEDKKAALSANGTESESATLAETLQHELDDLPDLQKAQEDPAEMARCLKKTGELKRRLEAQTQAKDAASS